MRLSHLAGRRSLHLLSGLLLASAAIRLGTDAGHAFAAGDAAQPPASIDCAAPPAALARALSEREEKARTRDIAQAERQAALDKAGAELSAKLAELTVAEQRLRDTLALAEGAAERDLTQLTAIYQAMKPKDAAALFSDMNPSFVAGFLGRMPAPEAGAILSGMKPDVAYAVSALLAGRNTDVPR